MSDAAIHDIVAGLPPTLMALAGLFVAWRNGTKAELAAVASKERAAVASAKADVIIEKADQIHSLTNDNLSRVSTALEVANTKIDGLHQLAAETAKNADKSR
jgi:hypothetical protein